ncbi:uncharacterized protein LOC110620947 [Manihot esculenta]|uniref:Uncharacterized protein n=1 Tax=Manihot esculenta TaxID=3983 RepID=A0A2C9VES8_MANES|nr:uncharacterized protein LOC110620947 [Manihot esculenta]OAY43195.1 hypothetical protein MANES_08G049900v8 [Manihot esculenta]
MGFMVAGLHDQLRPVVEAPPAAADASCYSHRSIETLVVVVAVITIICVIAGIIARLCGGQHFGSNGEHDIEGWVEKRCKSCIDGGVTTAPPPPPPAEKAKPPLEEAKPATEEAKK